MIRFNNFEVKLNSNIIDDPVKYLTVPIEEAIKAYKEGKRIAIQMNKRFYILDIHTTFTGDIEFLFNEARYYILD
jgi:ribosomal protein L21E